MIDIAKLTQENVGNWVEYKDPSRTLEIGKLKSWNDKYIFVVFRCDGQWHNFLNYTGVATNPQDLTVHAQNNSSR